MIGLKPFLLGSLATFAVAGALFGTTAQANVQQGQRAESMHLVGMQTEDELIYVSAHLVDRVTTYSAEEGKVELHVYAVNDFTGNETEVMSMTVPKNSVNDFIKEVNKYRQ